MEKIKQMGLKWTENTQFLSEKESLHIDFKEEPTKYSCVPQIGFLLLPNIVCLPWTPW